MSRRKAHQSINFIVAALKKLAVDPNADSRDRSLAIARLAIIDGIKITNDEDVPKDVNNTPPAPNVPDVDTLLANLKRGTNANT